MNLIQWEPFRDIERLFDETLRPATLGNVGWDLAVDVYEEKNNIIAKMQLPGVDPEKIEVTYEDNQHLRIAGSRDEKQEVKNKHYYSREIRQGSFERVVRLPAPVEQSKTSANYENGVLAITVPKKSETAAEKIKVTISKK
jgi:HSP20 family protein